MVLVLGRITPQSFGLEIGLDGFRTDVLRDRLPKSLGQSLWLAAMIYPLPKTAKTTVAPRV